MSLIDDYKNGKRYGTDWQAPSFQHMNDLVGTVSGADDKADNALSKSTTAENNSTNALTKATTAETNSTNAVNTANTANSNSQAAVTTANNANTKSDQAISTANDADTKATNAETTVNNLTQSPDVSEANKFGVVNVEIIGTETNDEKFKFSNLKGNGIATIAKTGSNGLQDIYTITFDNGGTFSFNVTNGKGITNISKTNTSGLVDTYTITYNDESTSIFTITNGDSIELRVADGYFQWKYTTSSTWNNLISLGELSNVDQELSETSTNAIANSAVTQALNNKSTITVNDIVQTTIDFISDPQTQINNLDANKADINDIPTNYVTTNTTQNISGEKIFESDIQVGVATLIKSDTNGAMEFGRRDGNASTPYIDFHTDGNSNTDYNSRILASGNGLFFTADNGLYLGDDKIDAVKSKRLARNQYNYRTTGGLIVKCGQYTGSSNSPSITFNEAFPTACVFAWITKSGVTSVTGYCGVNSISRTGFTAGDFSYGQANKNGVWIAIGY